MKKEYITPKMDVFHLERQDALLVSSDGEQNSDIGGPLGMSLDPAENLKQG